MLRAACLYRPGEGDARLRMKTGNICVGSQSRCRPCLISGPPHLFCFLSVICLCFRALSVVSHLAVEDGYPMISCYWSRSVS